MPGPPPAGVSSTARCRPMPCSRMLRVSSAQRPRASASPDEREAERAGKHLGIEGQDGRREGHAGHLGGSARVLRLPGSNRSAGASTTMRPPARSTTGTKALVKGRSAVGAAASPARSPGGRRRRSSARRRRCPRVSPAGVSTGRPTRSARRNSSSSSGGGSLSRGDDRGAARFSASAASRVATPSTWAIEQIGRAAGRRADGPERERAARPPSRAARRRRSPAGRPCRISAAPRP